MCSWYELGGGVVVMFSFQTIMCAVHIPSIRLLCLKYSLTYCASMVPHDRRAYAPALMATILDDVKALPRWQPYNGSLLAAAGISNARLT